MIVANQRQSRPVRVADSGHIADSYGRTAMACRGSAVVFAIARAYAVALWHRPAAEAGREGGTA